MRFVTYSSETSNKPTPRELPWDDLVEWLLQPRWSRCDTRTCKAYNRPLGVPKASKDHKCPHKSSQAWSPVILTKGATRASANVTALTAAVYDLDELDPRDRSWAKRLGADGLEYLVTSTHSSTPDRNSLRLVIRLDEPVPAEHWPSVWSKLKDHYEIPADESRKDLAGLYFLPFAPRGSEPIRFHNKGTPFVTSSAFDYIAPRPERSPIPEGDDHYLGEGERNAGLASVAGVWRSGGMTEEVMQAALHAYNEEHCEPPLDDDEVDAIIESICRYERGMDPAEADELEGVLEQVKKAKAPKDETEGQRASLVGDLAAMPLLPVKIYPTGFGNMDDQLGGGVRSRNLAVVVGAPGAGKSGLVIHIADSIQKLSSAPVLIVALELDRTEMVSRVAAPQINVAHREIAKGETPPRVLVDALGGKAIYLLTREQLSRSYKKTMALIQRECARIEEDMGEAPILIIDYLQRLAKMKAYDGEERRAVADACNDLFVFAHSNDTAVLAVSSVAREFYKGGATSMRKEETPPEAYMSLAKESGDVEFDASIILVADTGTEVKNGTRAGQLVIAKARHGTPSFVGARFTGATGAWQYDPTARNELLDSGNRSKVDKEDESALVEVKILEFVKRRADRPMPKSQLATSLGLRKAVASRAITALLSSGKLELLDNEHYNAEGRCIRQQVIVLPEEKE